MLRLYFNILCVFILTFLVDYCILTHGPIPTIGELDSGEAQNEYINSTYQFELDNDGVTASEDSSQHKSKRGMQRNFSVVYCSEDQPTQIPGYVYKFNLPSSRQFSNHIQIVSVGYAYLLTIKNNVLKKPHRYFDIKHFLDKSGIVFPPHLPLVCYDTVFTLHESPLFNYGKEDMLRDLNSAESPSRPQPSDGSSSTQLSATRHLNPNSRYMIQRQKMYGELGHLLRNLQKGQVETLKAKCSETTFTKITDLITELLGDNPLQSMSPDYSLEQFNELAKLFIGDIVAYEMIRQACVAMGIRGYALRFPPISDWTPVAEKLRRTANDIRNNWQYTQLQKDILDSHLDWFRHNYQKGWLIDAHSSAESLFEMLHSDALMEKYYQYGFRVSSHKEWTTDRALIREMCRGRQNQKCIDKSGKVFMLKWKSLKPSELSASYEAQEEYIKFPKVTPPSSSHNFAALYAKVQTVMKNVQNAVNYFRVNELQKTHYNNVDNLIRAFDHSAGYTFYSETAGHFAKTLDALHVLRREFPLLVNTLSEVAMQAGEIGIDKVWLLIERNFNEIDNYMADIEGHITQLRLKLKAKYAPLLSSITEHSLVEEFLFGGSIFEEVKQIRQAFKKYQSWALFYTEYYDANGTPIGLKQFVDKCAAVTSAIHILPSGAKMALLEHGMRKLGARGPFYIQTFLLVPSYDIAYLTLYSVLCTFQKYRWLEERNPVTYDGRMGTVDVQQFIRGIQQDVSDISQRLDEFIEITSTFVYRGEFYWLDDLWNEISAETEASKQSKTDANAERIANKLNVLFPWNSFTVELIKPYSPDNLIYEKNEKMYYYNFLSNPDYSMVCVHPGTKFTIIVNWAPDKPDAGTRPSRDAFGFYSSSDTLCDREPHQITYDVINYQNIKSLFIWRTYIGRGWHVAPVGDLEHERPSFTEGFKPLDSRTYGGPGLGIQRRGRTCWYKRDASASYCSGVRVCHADDQLAIYALANFAGDYEA